jgi:heme/copper-type cytochrome/quinol oxidase subunit 4
MSESSTTDLKSTIRRCGLVLLAVACTTALMISTSYSHIGGWPMKVTVILAVAAVNAFLVAAYLMHLLSEKKLVYTVLLFTVIFAVGLLGLTIWATQDFPPGTTH